MQCDKSVQEPRIEAVKSFSELNCCFGLGSVRQWSEEAVKSRILDRGFESRSHHQMEWYRWVAPRSSGKRAYYRYTTTYGNLRLPIRTSPTGPPLLSKTLFH